ncbi:MAG: hypothetical protein WCI39_09025 [Gallionellaceae bacterium]
MNKIINSVIVASITVLATSAAWACKPMHGAPCPTERGGMPCERHHAEMDANKDGVITKKEFDVFHSAHFKNLDTNKDGKLSQQEMEAASPMWGGRGGQMGMGRGDLISNRFEAADANKDGGLSREEAKDMPMLLQHFDEVDVNKDGKVTPDEIQGMMGMGRPAPATTEKAPEKK